jgi:catechol 2,3-dioxygenase-like lactoylglutathione lyase family enzyme
MASPSAFPLEPLAGPHRPLHHIGYAVEDLEAGVQWAVTMLGAGPFFLIEHTPLDPCTFRGEPATYDHSSAFGQWGPIIVELTLVHASKPPELAELMRGTPPQLGHVGLLADDLKAESDALAAAGLPLFHAGTSGPVSARWHDARVQLGHHIEVLKRCPEILGFYELIRSSAERWDGRDPLRPGPGGPH